MKKIIRNTLFTMTAISLIIASKEALAMDTFVMNSRAAGMGGAGIACSTDANAQYYNPAAFGFFSKKPEVADKLADPQLSGLTKDGEENSTGLVATNEDSEATKLPDVAAEEEVEPELTGLATKDWGLDINAGAGARIHGEIGDLLDTLADVDYDALSNSGIQTEEDIQNLIAISKSLSVIDDDRNAFSAHMAGNAAVRVGHVGVGVYGMAEASARVLDLDTANLGIDAVDATDLSSDIVAANTTVDTTTYVFQVFSTTQQDQLTAAGLSLDAVKILDSMAADEGVTTEEAAEVVDILEEVTTQSGTATTLDANTTVLVAQGFGVMEVPVSYGYALNDYISIGGNLKYMQGRVYGTTVLVFDDDNSEALDNIDSNYSESSSFGIDLGLMGRYGMFQYGLVLRNLNSPEFDGFTDPLSGYVFEDVKIKPQAAAGMALLPFENLTLAVDFDLTSNKTNLTNYETRFVRAGLEWDVFKVLALRVGAYSNMAEDDIGLVYTAGLGLNMWAVRLDVAGAYADEKINFDGDEVPAEANIMARLAIDF